jgi:hypothetical protein
MSKEHRHFMAMLGLMEAEEGLLPVLVRIKLVVE